MKYRFAAWFYYTFRGINRDLAARVANRLSPPNVRFGGSVSDIAADIARMRDEHPDWPVWDALDHSREEAASDAYVDSYGVSWG